MTQYHNFRHFFSLTKILLLLITIITLPLFVSACGQFEGPQGWAGGITDENNLYITSQEGSLYAIDQLNQTVQWKIPLRGDKGENTVYGTPTLFESNLYFGGYDGTFYSVEIEGGQIYWDYTFNSPIITSPAVNDSYLVIGTSDNNLHVIDNNLNPGKPLCSYSTSNQIWASPVIYNQLAIFGSMDHVLRAINLDNCELVWDFATQGAIVASPIISQDIVMFGSLDRTFYGLNAANGKIRWRFDGSSGWYIGDPASDNENVYAPSMDGHLYALDITTGMKKWSFDTSDSIVSSPVLVNKFLAVASVDGKVHIISSNNGQEQVACDLGEEIRSDLGSHNNIVFVKTEAHSIIALQIKDNGNPDEIWIYLTNEDDPIPRDRIPAC